MTPAGSASGVSSLPKHALITGGSSGIGLALALRLAKLGYSISLLARDETRLKAAADMLAPFSKNIFFYSVDVRDESALNEAVGHAANQAGPINLLVLSAGVATPGHFADLASSAFRDAMDINYFGSLHTVRAALPHMTMAAQERHIILISSGAGLIGIFGYSAYSPSKFAVRGLAEVLRAELMPQGIAVSVVYPPDTDTPQLARENLSKPMQTRVITARAGAWQADDIAKAIVNGIRSRRFVIAPGWTMTLLAGLHSLLGPYLRRSFDRACKRVSGA